MTGCNWATLYFPKQLTIGILHPNYLQRLEWTANGLDVVDGFSKILHRFYRLSTLLHSLFSNRNKTSKNPKTKLTQPKNASNLKGEQVRELRKAKGWSTRKLATEAGISQSMIVLIEKGVDQGGQPISPAFQVKLKKAFGLT